MISVTRRCESITALNGWLEKEKTSLHLSPRSYVAKASIPSCSNVSHMTAAWSENRILTWEFATCPPRALRTVNSSVRHDRHSMSTNTRSVVPFAICDSLTSLPFSSSNGKSGIVSPICNAPAEDRYASVRNLRFSNHLRWLSESAPRDPNQAAASATRTNASRRLNRAFRSIPSGIVTNSQAFSCR